MPSRTANFVSAVFASLLIGSPLTTASHGAVSVAENCLSGPKGAPPKGGHWYYRIDRATKRQCWYVGDAKEKPSRITSQNPSASQEPRQSIADARAELPMPQAQVVQDVGVTAAPANAANIGLRASAEVACPQRSVIASRWPEPSGTNASAGPGAAAGYSIANPLPNSGAVLPPALAAVTLAAADSSSEKPSAAIQMLLIVVIGALSLAGLMGSAIYRFGGTMRWNGGREIRSDRRANWDLADGERRSPAVYAADDPRRRIAAMIARLSRTSAA